MRRVAYTEVARAIAAAECDEERLSASNLRDAYYAISPCPETTETRIGILLASLRRDQSMISTTAAVD
jgi:hypothetical protein